MLLVLALVVIVGGGNDGQFSRGPGSLPDELRNWGHSRLSNLGAVDGTPDWRVRSKFDSDIHLRVAAVVDRETRQEVVAESILETSPAPLQAEGGLDVFDITIYCCLNDPGGAYCGRTASGVQVRPGVVACSLHWPFGTRFRIVGDTLHPEGLVECWDRGSGVTLRNHLDVHFEDCGIQEDPDEGTGWWWLQRVGDRAIVEVVR